MIKRNTIQRSLVLEAVNRLRNHATADELYAELVREHPHISRATVYRNLHLLAEEGKIRRLEIPGGADRFDHLCHEHCHVRCEACGRVFDVDTDGDIAAGLEKAVRDTRGFTFTGCEILFRGICPDCRDAAAGSGSAQNSAGGALEKPQIQQKKE